MFKILHVVGDAVGGIRKHVHDVLLGLNNEFEFYYVCSKVCDQNFEDDLVLFQERNIDVLQLDISKKPSFTDVKNIYYIYRLLKKEKIDIVHGHGAKGGLYARIAGGLASAKTIYTPHGGVAHSMFNVYEDFLYTTVEKMLFRFTDMYLFESLYTKDSFSKKIKKKSDLEIFSVNYNGIRVIEAENNAVDFRLKYPLKIGFIGMLREEKGILFSLKIMKRLREKMEFEYHIYGDGPLREKLISTIKDDQMESYVFYHGYARFPNEAMAGLSVIFVPSLFESFGYVAVEAMFNFKPLVLSDAGALTEVLPPSYPFVYDRKSEDSCLKCFEKLIEADNENQIEGLIFKNREFANNNFSLESMLSGLKIVYERLATTRNLCQ